MYKEGLSTFSEKNINFQGPCDLKRKENFNARVLSASGRNCRFSGIELTKIYRQLNVSFKILKIAKSLHPTAPPFPPLLLF